MKFEKSYELSAEGQIYIGIDTIRINTDMDICQYYKWFIDKFYHYTIKTQFPKHKAHITVVNPKIYGVHSLESLKHLHGERVRFYYSVDVYRSPRNFWIPVKCDIADDIKKSLGIIDAENYYGLHLTICNTKFETK